MGEEILRDELGGLQFGVGAGEFRAPCRPCFRIDTWIANDLRNLLALFQEIRSFHRPAIQMRLHLRSIDDPALFVARGPNDRDGLRSQLAHDDVIAGTGAGERLFYGSLQVLAPHRPFTVWRIHFNEVR